MCSNNWWFVLLWVQAPSALVFGALCVYMFLIDQCCAGFCSAQHFSAVKVASTLCCFLVQALCAVFLWWGFMALHITVVVNRGSILHHPMKWEPMYHVGAIGVWLA